jgi:flagellar biosynthesis protein FlhB
VAENSSESRAEEPTPRRIARSRRQGEVALSHVLGSGVALACACVALAIGGKAWLGGVVTYLRDALGGATGSTSISTALGMGLHAGAAALWPILAMLWVVALAAGLAQTRGNLASERLRADAMRLRPRLARILGRDNTSEAAADIFKLVVLCGVAYWSIRPWVSAMIASSGASASHILTAVGALVLRVGSHLAIAMVGLGIADYLWQASRHRTRLRMTRDEVRREHRELEGDPEQRAERRRLHRQLDLEEAVGMVVRADVVLVDPGVAAVAISYSGIADEAPVIVVRGRHGKGDEIEDAAHRAGVPCFIDPLLVRSLLSGQEGEAIPEEFYLEVASLLVKARRMRQVAGAASSVPNPSGETGTIAGEQAG